MAVDGDVLLLVLLAVEIRSLLQCCRVCKSWRGLIRSGWFRKAWSERHLDEQSSVLLSFAEGCYFGQRLGVRRWLPPSSSASSAQGIISPCLNLQIPGVEHSRIDIVASCNGLVCVCLDMTEDRCRYVVGNPVTGEWVHLPKFPPVSRPMHDDLLTEYSMRVYAGGEFKLQVLDISVDQLFVYTSGTRSWRKLSKACLRLPDTVMHDVDEGWISIKPPIKFNNARDSIASAARWSYKGQTYLAGCYMEDGVISLEHIVWKASRLEKKREERAPIVWKASRLEKKREEWGCEWVSLLAWDTGVNEEQVVREEVAARDLADPTRVVYHGEGKLLAAAVDISYGLLPPSVYDVSSNMWYHLRVVRGDLPGSGRTACTRAVVYHPSMIKPDQGGGCTRVQKRTTHALRGDRLPKQRKISVAEGC